jgi:hypothetical protein
MRQRAPKAHLAASLARASASSLYAPHEWPSMLVHVCARPVACPHSQQKACPQRQRTRLQLQQAAKVTCRDQQERSSSGEQGCAGEPDAHRSYKSK